MVEFFGGTVMNIGKQQSVVAPNEKFEGDLANIAKHSLTL